jgi:hypothetical protein
LALSVRLKAISAGASARIPADKRAIMAEATKNQRESGILDGVIKVGETLPAFSLKNQQGETVTSAGILAQGPMVLTVFRGIW